jgi:hypothetical protein
VLGNHAQPVAAREDHAPPNGSLPLAKITRNHRKPPKTRLGKGWKENRGHHAPKRETNSLARASHAPVRGCRLRLWRPSMDTEEASDPTEEVCVWQ